MSLILTSPSFEMNAEIPTKFTCDGENFSPELNFENIPMGTQSLALIMEDPDVPKYIRADGMWDHWVVWNIPPNTARIEEGQQSPGIIGVNTRGNANYGGPCPPDREHRYFFILYALNTVLDLPQGSTKEKLLQAISGHVVEKSILIGRYNRKQIP